MKLIETIREAGIVGCGGAGFPTHVKLDTKAEYLILNGAECEPLLRTDRYLMRHFAEQILRAAEAAGHALGASHICLAMKETYTEEKEAVQRAISETGSPVELFPLKNFYPAGDEQVMVYEVTGRVVPPAGLPADVGAVVSNVATMHAVCNGMEGKNFTEKYLTVTGAVEKPLIIKAPIGTALSHCIQAAVPLTSAYGFVLGGPLMGKVMDGSQAESQVVTKTTSGIILLAENALLLQKNRLSAEQMMKRAKSVCIQCARCTEMCPRHLMGHPLRPDRIMRSVAWCENTEELLNNPEVRQAAICSECGVCEEYACPMGLQPRKINQRIKTILTQEQIRYQPQEQHWEADPMREYRRVPSKRLAVRLGVEQYYDYRIDQLVELEPQSVSLPLKQHIGAPSIPLVQVGQRVTRGQRIAACPKGQLGAELHASIDGVVTAVSNGDISISK